MALLIHILIALTSIAYTTYLFVSPTKVKFIISYISVVLTIFSGTYLTILNLSHLAEACVAGLLYIGFVLVGIVLAHQKFAKQQAL